MNEEYEYLKQLAQLFLGNSKGNNIPEGSMVMEISYTLVQQIGNRLNEIADRIKENMQKGIL